MKNHHSTTDFLSTLKRKHDEETKEEKKKKKNKKEKRKDRNRDVDDDDNHDETKAVAVKKAKKEKKEKQKHQKIKRDKNEKDEHDNDDEGVTALVSSSRTCQRSQQRSSSFSRLPFPFEYILAPMVGASELAFRLLCRKYGAQLAYTPMMSAELFASDLKYRTSEFQTCAADRPLVCHFSANTPHHFRDAVRAAAPYCDAVDLNLGCPQRTAYLGHFGSYLLDPKDRNLVGEIVKAGATACNPPIPIFCKIRLLDTLQETIELCHHLQTAGASLIAVHARYRANWQRKGPGARDGPALLDQVTAIQKALPNIPIIANGNVITYQDVQDNRKKTNAAGVMSAEGILDNPALFLKRYENSSRQDKDDNSNNNKIVSYPDWTQTTIMSTTDGDNTYAVVSTKRKEEGDDKEGEEERQQQKDAKKEAKLSKKLMQIDKLERKAAAKKRHLTEDEKEQIASKSNILQSLEKLKKTKKLQSSSSSSKMPNNNNSNAADSDISASVVSSSSDYEIINGARIPIKRASLSSLHQSASDPLKLAQEYLEIAQRFPPILRTVIFHIRRMLKSDLVQYQLLEECLACDSVSKLTDTIIHKLQSYRDHPETFQYDQKKALLEKAALERKAQQEGKRKAYEARMIRKAKREGKTGDDLECYLHIGAVVPTQEIIQRLKTGMTKEEALVQWKNHHSQHCMSFHLDPEGCKRGPTCAFLHVEASTGNAFHESDEIAG